MVLKSEFQGSQFFEPCPTQTDLVSDVLEGVLHVEEHLEGVGDDSWLLHGAPHRVGLAAARLAVREDRHVVAVHYRLKLFIPSEKLGRKSIVKTIIEN